MIDRILTFNQRRGKPMLDMNLQALGRKLQLKFLLNKCISHLHKKSLARGQLLQRVHKKLLSNSNRRLHRNLKMILLRLWINFYIKFP